jgi:hypothetical protein
MDNPEKEKPGPPCWKLCEGPVTAPFKKNMHFQSSKNRETVWNENIH